MYLLLNLNHEKVINNVVPVLNAKNYHNDSISIMEPFIKENLINMVNFMGLEHSITQKTKFATLGIGVKIIFMALVIYSVIILLLLNNNKLLNYLLLITETSPMITKRTEIQFGSITKENLKTIRKMVLGYYFLSMVVNLKAIFLAISVMVQVFSPEQMVLK
jgi:hypothetical protein